MKYLVCLLVFLMATSAWAQTPPQGTAWVVSSCGTPPRTYTAGTTQPLTVDTTGALCNGSAAGASAVSTTPASRTLVALDVATVTTGGTAVAALTAGHRTAGGWLQNPVGATINLCINEIGTASGTTSAGSTTCILPGQTYVLTPAAGAVSVISSDSSHPFSGFGLN